MLLGEIDDVGRSDEGNGEVRLSAFVADQGPFVDV